MRFMLIVRISTEGGNAAVREGRIGDVLQRSMDQLRPEAAYFGPLDGNRGCYLVVNFDDPSQIPSISETFFQNLHATVTFVRAMTPDELTKGVAALRQGGA